MNPEFLPTIVGGILVAIVALVIVVKFGRIIANVLTILGGLAVLVLAYWVYTSIQSGIDLDTIKMLLEMVK